MLMVCKACPACAEPSWVAGLVSGEDMQPASLEYSQGDKISGKISRKETAAAVLAALDTDAAVNKTFEVSSCTYLALCSCRLSRAGTQAPGRADAAPSNTRPSVPLPVRKPHVKLARAHTHASASMLIMTGCNPGSQGPVGQHCSAWCPADARASLSE